MLDLCHCLPLTGYLLVNLFGPHNFDAQLNAQENKNDGKDRNNPIAPYAVHFTFMALLLF
jgi:hypothetical protein